MLTVITVLSLLLPLAAFAGPPGSVQMRQPPAGGSSQRVAIQRVPARTIEQCEIERLAAALPGFTIRRVPDLDESGIVLLNRKPDATAAAAEKSIAEFLKANKEWVGVPIVKNGAVDQVPTNELIVTFKPGVSPAQAQEIFSARGLEASRHPTKHYPDRYVFRLGAVAAVLELAESFNKLPAVELARPAYISLFQPR